MSRNTWQTHIEKDKFDKLCNIPTEDRIKLVYEWIKTGKLTLGQFSFLCEELLLGSQKEKHMTKFIAKINGFSITQRMVGHKDTYFMAYRKNDDGADKLFTAKRLGDLENEINKKFPVV